MKKILVFVFVIFCIACTKESATKFIVTGDNVNVRIAPDSTIIGKLQKKDTLTVIKIEDNWVNFTYDDTNAYVSRDFVKAKKEQTFLGFVLVVLTIVGLAIVLIVALINYFIAEEKRSKFGRTCLTLSKVILGVLSAIIAALVALMGSEKKKKEYVEDENGNLILKK